MSKTLFEKIWDKHVVDTLPDGTIQLYIDRLYCHEVTSPQAFAGLRARGLKPFRPAQITCMPDHNIPTLNQDKPIEDPISKNQVDTLEENAKYFGLTYYGLQHPKNGIIHVVGPETGLTQPGMTINFTCRIQTKYDETWQYCDFISVPFEYGENGHIVRFTGFRQNIPKIQQLNRELKERNYKIELSFKTVGISYWDFDVRTQRYTVFNDPVNDYHPEKEISYDAYINVAHPDDVERVRHYMNHMLRGVDKDFNFKYRSKTKWDKEWQTLLVTGIQVEKAREGGVIRYTGITINNTKWER